jgi:hypothetical protein
MDPRLRLVRADLFYVFDWFDLSCLRFVRDNRHRLIRKHYRDDNGNGCLMGLLSRTLPAGYRIGTRADLTRFFTGGTSDADRELPGYAPAKWIVRLIDGEKVERYGGLDHVGWDFILGCLDEAIAARESIESEGAAAEANALARLKARRRLAAG